jgi:hypothetical protein
MKNVLLMIRNGAFAVAIAVALSFGAAEALSGPPGATWLPPALSAAADTMCTFPDLCVEDDDCIDICGPPWLGGTCDYDRAVGHKCCVCFD